MTIVTKRATMRDVAAEAGVSHALVSLVYRSPEKVSEERRRRVLAAAANLGFRPNLVASSLSSYRGNFVGILVSNLHNPVFSDIVDAARAELDQAGLYGLMSSAILPGNGGPARVDRRIVHSFEDLNTSGFLVVGVVPDLSVFHDVRPALPIVVAAASIEELPRAASVRTDNEIGMRELVGHLVSRGHTKIAHLGGQGGPAARGRAAAYELAMIEHGLEHEIHVQPAEFFEESGRRAAEALLEERPQTTAITCLNDLVALGAMTTIERSGRRIPNDIAVAGYDNTFLTGLDRINMTTVDTQAAEIGRVAASWLAASEPPQPGQEQKIAPKLVIRGTT